MKILIIGAGMYVTGRGTDSPGTVLYALAQVSKEVDIERVTICATQPENEQVVASSAKLVNIILGTHLEIEYKLFEEIEREDSFAEYDCGIVCIPDHLHFEYASLLMNKGLHLQIVKPLTPRYEEAKELVRLQEEKGVYACVEFHKRYDESNQLVKRMVMDNELGLISYFAVQYSQRIKIPLDIFRRWAAETNVFQYLGVHYVDLVYFLTGYIPKRVMAVGTKGIISSQGIETQDSILAMIEWNNPQNPQETFQSQFAINWIDPNATTAVSDQHYIVVGEKGRLNVDQKNRGVEFSNHLSSLQLNPYFSICLAPNDHERSFSGYGYQSIRHFVLDVQEILQGNSTPEQLESCRPTLKQALVSTLVLEHVRRSLNNDSAWSIVDDHIET